MNVIAQESSRRAERRQRRAYSCPGLSPKFTDTMRAIGMGSFARIGAIASAGASPPGPLVVMAGHVVAGFIPESGLTSTSWADQGSGAHNLAGTCTVQTNQINGYSCATFNGSTNTLSATVSIAAPGTTPSYVWCIARLDTWSSNVTVCALGGTNQMAIVMHTSSPQLSQFSNGAFGNSNATGASTSAFKRIRSGFTNSASDMIQIAASTAVTGTNAGNTAGTGINLAASNGSHAAISIVEWWLFNADPGTSLDAYATAKFGAGVLS